MPCGTPFPVWNQCVVPCPVLTVASWPAYRFLKRQVRWSGIPISQNFPQFLVIHTVKGFGVFNKPEIGVFLELSCFLSIQRMLAIWNLVPLPFLNPAWTSGSSQFMYCWSLAWRLLYITLLVCEMSAVCGSLSILWHCLFLGLEWKLTFSSPVATAELSKFAAILNAALS